MKTYRFLIPIIVFSLSVTAFAQHDHGADPAAPAPPTEAQKSFDTLKTLAGTWEGPLTITPNMPGLEKARMKVQIRVTSRGNAIMHEMSMTGMPDDPITMLYVNGDSLSLTHYCDAGNRPHMTGSPSADGKTVAFKVVDVSGSDAKGHMADTVFTVVDATHHVEQWTYQFPGQQPAVARFDLVRIKDASGAFGQ